MDITARKGRIEDEPADAVLLIHCEGERQLAPAAAAVDARLRGRLADLITSGEFTGRLGQVSILHVAPGERLRTKRVVLAGLGKRKDASLEKLRQATGSAAKAIRTAGAKSFAVPVPDLAGLLTSVPAVNRVRDVAQTLAEGAILGLYQFTTYRTERKDETAKAVRKMSVVAGDPRALAQAQQGVRQGQIIGEATAYVRDLCNHPANVVTPTYIANEAKKIARERGVSAKVLDRPAMQRLGMGALLGVARGSHEPPKFVILEYRGGPRGGRPVALVGKTVTFDSGGISLKSADNMEQMKADMTGGAAVLAAVRAASRLRLPVNIVALIPATENMPGGSATKPGDILTSLSGKTIEVINTDAEGRLILCDALTYAERFEPEAVVDIATLTGACVIALGHVASGLFSNKDALARELLAAGDEAYDRAWHMPLWDDYQEQLKSNFADMANIGGRPAGSVTAACFLSRYAKKFDWAHLDIAGTAWKSGKDKGSTGRPVALLASFLMKRAGKGL